MFKIDFRQFLLTSKWQKLFETLTIYATTNVCVMIYPAVIHKPSHINFTYTFMNTNALYISIFINVTQVTIICTFVLHAFIKQFPATIVDHVKDQLMFSCIHVMFMKRLMMLESLCQYSRQWYFCAVFYCLSCFLWGFVLQRKS